MKGFFRTILNFLVNEINKFSFALEPVFYQVLLMSIIATIVGFVIFIILKILDKEIYSKYKVLIWLLFIFALVCPFKLKTNFSIYKFCDNLYDIPDISYREEYDKIKKENHADSIGYDRRWAEKKEQNPDGDFSYVNEDDILTVAEVENREKNIQYGYIKSLIIDVIIPMLWISVLGLGILFVIIDTIILNIKISKYDFQNERLNKLLENAKLKLSINGNIRIVVQDFINVPSICGIIKPKILIPKSILENDDKVVEYAIMHELSHFKRKDLITSNILLLLEIFYWFNPILWIFFKEIRNEIEVCTDENVLETISEKESKEYAMSMIEIAKKYKKPKFSDKLICIVDGKKNLERRIINIERFERVKSKLKYVIPLSFIIIVILYVLFISEPIKYEGGLEISEIEENYTEEFPNPDRIIFKLDDENYYIFTPTDREYSKIIKLLADRITNEGVIQNIQKSFNENEVLEMKSKETFVELDYNTISKNYLFLLDNENFQMLKYTDYGASLVEKKLSSSNDLKNYLLSSIKNKKSYEFSCEQYLFESVVPEINEEYLKSFHYYSDTKTYSLKFENENDRKNFEKQLNINFDASIDKNVFEKNNIVAIVTKSKITDKKFNIGNIKLKISGQMNSGFYIYYLVVSKTINSNCIYVEKGYENTSLYGSKEGKVLKVEGNTIYINRSVGSILEVNVDDNTKITSYRNDELEMFISDIKKDDEIYIWNYYKFEDSDAKIYGIDLRLIRNNLSKEEIEKEVLKNRTYLSGEFVSVNLDENYFVYKVYGIYDRGESFEEKILINEDTHIIMNNQKISINQLEEYAGYFISLVKIMVNDNGEIIATNIEFTDN